MHINRFGIIPKSGKWRLIVDLSHPEGKSVNSGMDRLCSLSYFKIHVVEKLLEMGPGVELAKLDVKSVFHNVLVHPEDRYLLGMQWRDQVHVDAVLSFYLRSVPKIFNALDDAIEWIVKQNGVEHLWHYLDDFLTCGEGGSVEYQLNLQTMKDICESLGVPLAMEKLEVPSTPLVFLGNLIDTVAQELRLPIDKLEWIRESVRRWLDQNKKRCTKQ